MYIIYCVYNKIILFVFLHFWGFLWYLENLLLVNTECTFPVFASLMTYLGYIFFTRCLYLYHNWWWKRGKDQFFKYFERFCLRLRKSFGNSLTLLTLDNLNTQKNELHTNSEDISEIKLISLLPSAQNSRLIIWTLLVLNIFYLILIIALTLDS